VITPRHFLIFRLRRDSAVEIVRVLHDSMDLARHLPPAE
jgi:toxin ParE1/3/4